MTSSSDELRLVATFEDRISGPMKKAIEQLRGFGAENARTSERGARGVKEHSEQFTKLTKAVRESASTFRGDFLPGLEKTVFTTAEAGVGLGAVAAAIGAAGAAAKAFATQALDLKRAGRETGLSVDEIRRWEALGPLIGTTSDAMKEAAASFNDLMEKMQRNPNLFRSMFADGEGKN